MTILSDRTGVFKEVDEKNLEIAGIEISQGIRC